MRKISWQVWAGFALLIASIVLYVALYEARPGRAEDIFFYTFLDVAFIPINVLLVGLILNGMLSMRERRSMLRKLNMVIGAFFSEVGTGLLGKLAAFDPDVDEVRADLVPRPDWDAAAFAAARKDVTKHGAHADARLGDLAALRDFLNARRSFMLGLLQNPNLLEHASFTELIWAVMHLTEELQMRADLEHLSEADLDHLSIDIGRAYAAMTCQWLEYVQHLKADYPYLFALAVRTNPLDPEARVEVG
jgi:hypothetical protein